MIKKTYILFLTTMLCPTTAWPQENSDSPYKTGTIIMTTTAILATAYIANSYIKSRSSSPQEKSNFDIGSNSGLSIIITDDNNLSIMGSVITLGAIIAEGLNHLEKNNNSIIKKDGSSS